MIREFMPFGGYKIAVLASFVASVSDGYR